jgi:hypothetical protein
MYVLNPFMVGFAHSVGLLVQPYDQQVKHKSSNPLIDRSGLTPSATQLVMRVEVTPLVCGCAGHSSPWIQGRTHTHITKP